MYVQAYRAAFSSALEAEHSEEWQLAQERLTTWSQHRLQVVPPSHSASRPNQCLTGSRETCCGHPLLEKDMCIRSSMLSSASTNVITATTDCAAQPFCQWTYEVFGWEAPHLLLQCLTCHTCVQQEFSMVSQHRQSLPHVNLSHPRKCPVE